MNMMLYFAYGSNLDETQMKERCPESELIAPGWILDYKLCFTRYSPRWSGGVADIVKDEGSVVWGLVYEISAADLESLDRYEGHPDMYTRFPVTVLGHEQTYPDAWVYEVVDRAEHIPPTQEYLNIIKHAARRHRFPADYQKYLDRF